MNIFYTDTDPATAAQNLCDSHVVKMALETAQILSTAARALLGDHITPEQDAALYKATHAHHPSVLWAGHNVQNADWLYAHGMAIFGEYYFRFGNTHRSGEVLTAAASALVNVPFVDWPNRPGFTAPPQAMPDVFKGKDAVDAYRRYYHHKAATIKPFRYTNRMPPTWLNMN